MQIEATYSEWFSRATVVDERTRDAAFAGFTGLGEKRTEFCQQLLRVELETGATDLTCLPAEMYYDQAIGVLRRLRMEFPEIVRVAESEAIGNFIKLSDEALAAALNKVYLFTNPSRKFAAIALANRSRHPSGEGDTNSIDDRGDGPLWTAMVQATRIDGSPTDCAVLWTGTPVRLPSLFPFVFVGGQALGCQCRSHDDRRSKILGLLNSSVPRSRLIGLAAIPLASFTLEEVIPGLLDALDGDDEDVRRCAAEVIASFGYIAAEERILSRLSRLHEEEQETKGPHYYGQLGYSYYSSFARALSALL